MKIRVLTAAIHIAISTIFLCPPLHAQNMLKDGGAASAPDDWLLARKGSRWWYEIQPSLNPVQLQNSKPTVQEQVVVESARALFANRPAKAIALMDGAKVLYLEYKTPADDDSYLSGFSMGKTVTAMAVGQALCDGKLKMETIASELMPELNGKALGKATVRDLLRMASGAAEPNADSTVWTPAQFQAWKTGELNLVNLVSDDRVAKAARGVFSEYKPGEHFSYKQTDPFVLGIMVSRATGITADQWMQAKVLDPMGVRLAGIYQVDREKNGLADSGLRMHMEDWMRFALWVKRSSMEAGCFGDFVRASATTQIANDSNRAARKAGTLFDGYGYLTWTDSTVAPGTSWAVGWGGQRIGWDKNSDRMVIVFSNAENWMQDIYGLAKDWNGLSK